MLIIHEMGGSEPMMVEDIRRIAVVGAGLMGHGIAQDYALGGYEVALHSRTQASLDRALANIEANLERLVGLELVTPAQAAQVPARLRTSTAFEEAVRDADVVVESVFEDLALKRRVFKRLDDACPDRTILASNTSSLMPTRIAEATRRADRVIATHYTNPPYLVPLVEVVRAEDTSDSTVATVSDLLTRVGKRPILVQKEVPGFVLNRLQFALLREALWLVEHRVATARDVDVGIRSSIGRRWAAAGVFEVLEVAGWDLVLDIASGLFPHLSSTEVPETLEEKVARGELGVKAGRGFYDWTPKSSEALKGRIAHALAETEKWTRAEPPGST